jgi:hypothetical protein
MANVIKVIDDLVLFPADTGPPKQVLEIPPFAEYNAPKGIDNPP